MFPSLVRSVEGEYWHRPRSARWYPNGWTWQTWCGVSFPDARVSTSEDAAPRCGTCTGRAQGVGPDPTVTFSPRYLRIPKWCPGSTSQRFERLGPRVGRCPMCGEIVPTRFSGGPYDPVEKLCQHHPADGFVACPEHTADYLSIRGGVPWCERCGPLAPTDPEATA